jgi:hypothetical protein
MTTAPTDVATMIRSRLNFVFLVGSVADTKRPAQPAGEILGFGSLFFSTAARKL